MNRDAAAAVANRIFFMSVNSKRSWPAIEAGFVVTSRERAKARFGAIAAA
jgi:hypothetical protein